MMLWWPASSPQTKDEIQNFSTVNDKLLARKDKAEADFLEVVDAHTGKALAGLAVTLWTKHIFMGLSLRGEVTPQLSGNWMAIADDQNRVVTYSLVTGNPVGNFFGHDPTLAYPNALMALENEAGHLTLYDLTSGEDLTRWVFTSPIRMKKFTPDGKRLFVLTSDQSTFILDLTPYIRIDVATSTGSRGAAPPGPIK